MFSTDSAFSFFADGDKPIGTLRADLFEARAFRTSSPALQQPYFRFAGFGPCGEGTGQFKEVKAQLTVNGALSLTPGVVSSMYMLRILDPLGRFRAVWP
jgi:hypothetical protein